jgi:hypothetical protein
MKNKIVVSTCIAIILVLFSLNAFSQAKKSHTYIPDKGRISEKVKPNGIYNKLKSAQSPLTNITTKKNGNWFDTSVWSTGTIPTSADNVTINHTITVNDYYAECNSLTINATKSLTIAADCFISVYGSITNNGTLAANAGVSDITSLYLYQNLQNNTGAILNFNTASSQLYFIGSVAQSFTNSGTITGNIIQTLVIDNPAGVTIPTYASRISVYNMYLMQGVLTKSAQLKIGNGTSGFIQRGDGGNSGQNPAGSFDASPTFNAGTKLTLFYSTCDVSSTGFEIPSNDNVYNFYLSDIGGEINLNSNLIITNQMQIIDGDLNIGSNTITFNNSAFRFIGGSVTGGTNSSIVFTGSTSTTLSNIINGLKDLTINNSAGITMLGNVSISNNLNLTSGTLSNANYLTLNNNSNVYVTGGRLASLPNFAGQVNVFYSGAAAMSSGYELGTASTNNLTKSNTAAFNLQSLPSSFDVIYSQGFNTTSVPAGWTTTVVASPGAPPVLSFVTSSTTPFGYTYFPTEGTGLVSFNSSLCDSGSVIDLKMTTPFSTLNKSNIKMSFDFSRDWEQTFDDKVTLMYSTNGTTFTAFANDFYRYINGDYEWKTIEVSLPAALENKSAVYIAFRFTSANGNDCHLDNFKVTAPTFAPSTTYTINGTLALQSNNFLIGANTLGLNGSLTFSGGATLTGGTTSSIIAGGTGANLTLPALTLYSLTVNRGNGVTLSADMNIANNVTFLNGVLTTGTNKVNYQTTANTPVETNSSYTNGISVMLARNAGTGSLYFLNCYIAAGADNLGNVTITRYTGTQGIIIVGANSSIKSMWNVVPVNQPVSGRNITYEWLPVFDNGHAFGPGVRAQMFTSTNNGTSWSAVGNYADPTGYSTTLRGITATITHFSQWTISGEDAPLPVTLSAFTAVSGGRDVQLHWATESEINNEGFNIEKTISGLNNWAATGFVKGSGTKSTPTNYSFTDKNLESGTYQYRLKQIDNNGNYQYFTLSTVIEISLPSKFTLLQNYPNPFNPSTKIDFSLPNDAVVNLKIYDITGREVAVILNELRKAGYYSVTFDASKLSSGVYFYKIAAGDFSDIKRMVLVK